MPPPTDHAKDAEAERQPTTAAEAQEYLLRLGYQMIDRSDYVPQPLPPSRAQVIQEHQKRIGVARRNAILDWLVKLPPYRRRGPQ